MNKHYVWPWRERIFVAVELVAAMGFLWCAAVMAHLGLWGMLVINIFAAYMIATDMTLYAVFRQSSHLWARRHDIGHETATDIYVAPDTVSRGEAVSRPVQDDVAVKEQQLKGLRRSARRGDVPQEGDS